VSYHLRLARPADVPFLAPLERAAAARFATVGLEAIVRGRSTDVAEYRAAIAAGRLWVVEQEGEVTGLAIAERLDGEGYLAKIAVAPRHAGRRLAARMIDAVAAWAARQGCRRLYLTTFCEVPWNRPYYEQLGFMVVDEAAAGPGLRAKRAQERVRGVDRHGARVCMVREIRTSA